MTDADYLRAAYRLATTSPDPSTQNGAIILTGDGPHVFGINTSPKFVASTPERLERPLKYSYIEHAERNAIYEAARRGFALEGGTMYCPWIACTDCGRAIIQSGIRDVVCHHDPMAKYRLGYDASEMWLASIEISLSMLRDAGVSVRWIEDKLFIDDEVSVLYNGARVSP